MRAMLASLLAIIVPGLSAAASYAPDFKGTVDASTPRIIARARHDAENAGYRPTAVEFVQDGNVFLTATRDNQVYEITVSPCGKAFVSTGLPKTASATSG